MCEKCERTREVLQGWADKQGHDRCWYFPEIFEQLASILDVHATLPPRLPERDEFLHECQRYYDQEGIRV